MKVLLRNLIDLLMSYSVFALIILIQNFLPFSILDNIRIE